MTRIRFHDGDRAVVAAIDIPHAAGRITVACVGESRAHALVRAASVADRVMSDPVIGAIVPSHAHAANEVGFLPLIIAAASAARKYGPVAVKAYKAYKARADLAKRAAAAGDHEAAEALATEAKLLAAKIREAAAVPAPAVSEVGWNPFRKKKKKQRAARRSVPRPSREQSDDQGGEDEQQSDDEESEG